MDCAVRTETLVAVTDFYGPPPPADRLFLPGTGVLVPFVPTDELVSRAAIRTAAAEELAAAELRAAADAEAEASQDHRRVLAELRTLSGDEALALVEEIAAEPEPEPERIGPIYVDPAPVMEMQRDADTAALMRELSSLGSLTDDTPPPTTVPRTIPRPSLPPTVEAHHPKRRPGLFRR